MNSFNIGKEIFYLYSKGVYFASTSTTYYIYMYYTNVDIKNMIAVLEDPVIENLVIANMDNADQLFLLKRHGKVLSKLEVQEREVYMTMEGNIHRVCFYNMEPCTAYLNRMRKVVSLLS